MKGLELIHLGVSNCQGIQSRAAATKGTEEARGL